MLSTIHVVATLLEGIDVRSQCCHHSTAHSSVHVSFKWSPKSYICFKASSRVNKDTHLPQRRESLTIEMTASLTWGVQIYATALLVGWLSDSLPN
jgi:uncharacterized CHY-type Zn-finger protein